MSNARLITIAEAAKLFPARNGKRPHIKSIRRRILKGAGGVKLRAVRDGGRWYTTEEWVREFQEKYTAASLPGNCPHPAALLERHDRAKERLLRRYGLHVGNNAQASDAQS